LHLSGVVDLQLSHFASHNVLDSLTLQEVAGPLVPSASTSDWISSPLIQLELTSVSGLGGKILAQAVEVMSFTPPR
jgi:hypothetical protein